MTQRMLVAYATRAGSTREIADFMGRLMIKRGKTVDVLDVKTVKQRLDHYDALLLGSNIRAGQLMPEVLHFAERNATLLAHLPKAYFVVCGTLRNDTPDNRARVDAYLEPLMRISPPVCKGLFAGRIDPNTMDLPWRFILKNVAEGSMVPGDFRNWDLIRQWIESLIPQLERQPTHA